MMMTQTEIVARFTRLEPNRLSRWIAVGWLRPRESESGFLFDDTDVARANLLYDLCYEMELKDDELGIVLSMVDRLNGTRSMLRALTLALAKQPVDVQHAIMTEVRALLAE